MQLALVSHTAVVLCVCECPRAIECTLHSSIHKQSSSNARDKRSRRVVLIMFWSTRKWHTCWATMPNQCKQICCLCACCDHSMRKHIVPHLIYWPPNKTKRLSRLCFGRCVAAPCPYLPILGSQDNYNWMRLIAVARPKRQKRMSSHTKQTVSKKRKKEMAHVCITRLHRGHRPIDRSNDRAHANLVEKK